MTDRYIIAFDPGVTTGVAWTTFGDEIDATQITGGAIGVWEWLEKTQDAAGFPDVIVYEKFLYQRRDKVVLDPVEVIGVIKLWAHQNVIPIQGLTAAQAKGFWSDKKLKTVGVYETGLKHANDAIRHLLYYLSFGQEPDLTWINRLKENR